MMNKIFYILTIIVATLWALGSCSNEEGIDQTVTTSTGHTVVFSIDGGNPITRATPSGNIVKTAALPREKAIANIYAVTFKSNIFYKTFKAVPEGAGYKFDVLQAGDFDVFLVANPDAALVSKLESAVATPAQLAQLVASQEPGADNTATNFLMTAEKFSVTTTAGTDTNAGTIILTRAAARFDLYNRVEGLTMSKITFKQRAVNSRIATGADMTGLSLTNNKNYESAQGLAAHECIAAIYSYENTEVGNSILTLEGTFKGKAIQPRDIVIGGVPVKRNHLYSVIISSEGGNVTPGDPGKLKFEIVVNDWNEGTTLEWSGDNLINKNAPSFTVSGTNVTPNTPDNPTEVKVGQSTANEITVLVTSDASSGSKLEPVAALPAGYSITPGTVGNANGKLTQEFTIHLPENLGTQKSLDFSVMNAFDPSAKRDFTLIQKGKQDRPKMAIEYVAEYNIGTTSGEFTTSHANDQSGYYSWSAAKAMTMPTGYHLPSRDEWRGIVPDYNSGNNAFYGGTSSTNDYSESITINGVTKTYTADYRNKGNGITYALRFKGNGNTQLAAYRYERVGNFVSNDLNSQLKITVRYLGEGFTGSVADIETESYWTANSSDDVTRVFPAAGWKKSTGSLEGRGTDGHCWTSDEYSNGNAWYVSIDVNNVSVYHGYSKAYQWSVRPFSD